MKGKKTGGRVSGTPNKNNPIKLYLRDHSLVYFTPNIEYQPKDKDGNPVGEKRLVSQYDIDLMDMKPADRVSAELNLLNYHTAKMQSVSADVSVEEKNKTLTSILVQLSGGGDEKR